MPDHPPRPDTPPEAYECECCDQNAPATADGFSFDFDDPSGPWVPTCEECRADRHRADDAIARAARWAATASPAGTDPGSIDALESATELVAASLDRQGVAFTMQDLQDAINAAQ